VLEIGSDCFVHVEGVEVGFAEADYYALWLVYSGWICMYGVGMIESREGGGSLLDLMGG